MDQILSNQRPENEKQQRETPLVSGVDTSRLATQVEKNVVSVETAGAVSGAVESLTGLEAQKPAETERAQVGEAKDPTGAQTAATAQAQNSIGVSAAQVPPATQPVMVRTVKIAIAHELEQIETEVKKLRKNALQFTRELAEAFQKLRTLKSILRNIAALALETLQMLYAKVMRKETLATVRI